MDRVIYWIVLVAILAELAAVLLFGGVPAATLLQGDIGIGFTGAVTAVAVLVIAFFANRIVAILFPVWHRRPSEWRAQQQQHWQQPDRYRGGQ